MVTTGPAPVARATLRAYAARPSGVHGISLDEAVMRIRACPARGSAEAADYPLVWIDILQPGEPEAALLRDQLGFHPLAVEDSIRGRQRPKLERYPGYFFLVMYSAHINPERDRMGLTELHVFLGDRYVVTVHDSKVREVGEVLARWRGAPHQFQTVGALAHGLMDAVVDHYIPVLNHFAERVERTEDQVFERADDQSMQQIIALRRELAVLRRVVAPERDVLSTLLRRDLPFLSPDLVPYFQDVYDHTVRETDEIDTLRDALSTILAAHQSAASQQLNQTVRTMTAWSIILMTLAWIAGIYGMNFNPEASPYNMPELGMRYGYPGALLAMALAAGFLLFYFRRRRWI